MFVVQRLVTGCLCRLCLLYRNIQNMSLVVVDILAPFPFSPIVAVHIQRGDESTGSEGTVKEREKEEKSVQTVMLIRCYYPPLPADSF